MTDNDPDLQLASDLRTVMTRMIKKMRSKSPSANDLSLTERAVIKLLAQYQQLSPSEMAAQEKITTQSMSQIINHLSAHQYIVRTASATDKRKVIISLSETGLTLLQNTRHERDEWLNSAISERLTKAEQNLLRKCIVPLAKLVDHE